MSVRIVHSIPNRVRFSFNSRLSNYHFSLLADIFNYEYEDIVLVNSSQGYGCVIYTRDIVPLPLDELHSWLLMYFKSQPILGPLRPPTIWQIRRQKTKEVLIDTMMFLAIAGWILPIMPGTPFFLIAWSLGWRPPNSKHSINTLQT